MRIVIADDEAPLRAWLRRLLLEQLPGAEIVAEAGNGTEALAAIAAHAPTVAFLDIRMPELSGLEVASRLQGACRIVFVTAYDQFAVHAFEHAAVDYLVKPVTPERLQKTLARLAEPQPAPASTERLLQTLLAKLDTPPAPATQPALRWLRVGSDDTVHLLDVRDVDFFKAADKYTEAHSRGKIWLVRTPLSELEKQLDADEFWRIHRSIVVRVAAIGQAQRDLMGRLSVRLIHDGPALPVSRSHAHLFNRN